MSPVESTSLPLGSRPCSCVVSGAPARLIVITGGPGAGKTAALEMARRSFCKHVAILPEAAGIVFGGGFPRGSSDAARRAAQRAIYHVQRQLEILVQSEPEISAALCDRGVVDGLAYWPEGTGFWSDLGTNGALEMMRYAAVVHLRTPTAAQGFDNSNPLRIESAAQATVLDARIADAWAEHPRRVEVSSHVDFLEKARRVLEAVQTELPSCCRGCDRA